MTGVLVIDGSYGEGGGQVLRTSLSLSAILGQPVRIENIRRGRKRPGLQPQHLTAARAVARICGGALTGDEVGSATLELRPRSVKPGDYLFDVSEIKPSAGSVNLILQTLILPLALAGKSSRVTIRGGTHVPMSPASNYIDEVYLPVLSRMGILVHYQTRQVGYYPIGGGEIRAEIMSAGSIRPLTALKRDLGTVTCFSAVSNLPMSIAERQMTEAVARLAETGISPIEVLDDYPSPGKGTVAFILHSAGDVKAGFSSLGEKGKPAEKVAREAAIEFVDWYRSGAALDKHLADQLIVPLSLASGVSEFTTSEISDHLTTNIATVGRFLPAEISVDTDTKRVRIVGAQLP